MALFEKLFGSRRARNHKKQNDVSGKYDAFKKDQVRVVLFRECDFRGRKLLFDSAAVEKVLVHEPKNEKFAEVSGNDGYVYKQLQSDCNHLSELIFGLISMKFHGAYSKIHTLKDPHRLMFTQVFSSPRRLRSNKPSTRCSNCASSSSGILQHSMNIDSSSGSVTSFTDNRSTASDTVLVYRRPCTNALDVPHCIGQSPPSIIIDSGYCGDRTSCSSLDSGADFNSIPPWKNIFPKGTLSYGSLYKRWFRSTSTSLDCSGTSSNDSAEDYALKRNTRPSKLGLAFIIQLSTGKEEEESLFFMEHVALMEAMFYRCQSIVGKAYNHPTTFISALFEMTNESATWLTDLLSRPSVPTNLWSSLSNVCDNNNSISAFKVNGDDKTVCVSQLLRLAASKEHIYKNCRTSSCNDTNLFNFSNIFNYGQFVSSKCDKENNFKWFMAKNFIQDFCELLEIIDVKDTNFFISTLLTAILTHHLGWVASVLPGLNSVEDILKCNPYNPLWIQISDIYGAVGNPTKISQTVVTGTDKQKLITKILNSLTYFIRCCNVERKFLVRKDVDRENKTADRICRANSCIPKENYKTYEDHLREMMDSKDLKTKIFLNENKNSDSLLTEKVLGKNKSTTCFDLIHLDKIQNYESVTLTTNTPKLTKLSKQRSSTNLHQFFNNTQSEITANSNTEEQKNVIFVLGDDEKLVGIKKDENKIKLKTEINQNKKSNVSSQSDLLELIFKKYETFEAEFAKSNFKDENFTKYETSSLIKPSTSWASLNELEEKEMADKVEHELYSSKNEKSVTEKQYVRSQSVPPEDRKTVKEEVKAKYKYSGIKFNLFQYPQVVTNYMRSKNLEMANFSFADKVDKFSQVYCDSREVNLDLAEYESNDELEALQTPSNASELEFTSDLTQSDAKHRQSKESSVIYKNHVPNTTCEENIEKKIWLRKQSVCGNNVNYENEKRKEDQGFNTVEFPMPESSFMVPTYQPVSYTTSLMKGIGDAYVSDMALQGITNPKEEWEFKLKNDLALATQHRFLDQQIEEAVAIVADTDAWQVHLMSSHTYVIDKSSSGIRVGMSQLVANMLESLLSMWKLHVSPEHCLMHIEQKLQELCVRSKALAQLLLATEFCSMEFLTSTLHVEVNDVALLLAVASTHSPQVTQKYGISFQ